ncbi:MAG: 3-(methylthio)propionyl-CoA ligase [Pseudomonadota bacterium]
MRGLMMERPLSIISLIQYAAQYHADTEIVSRTVEGPIHRTTYADSYTRIQKLAHALKALGVEAGDRVATLAWNGYRHFELYYAISGIGAVCHTINPRLFGPQIRYIVNHAEDKFIFTDLTFVPLLEGLAAELAPVEGYVVMTDAAHMPKTRLKNVMCYEDLIGGRPATFDWPQLDEGTASSLCYSSGTTGDPKGVLYTHRSTVLHSFAINQADVLGLSSADTVLPIVPLFHVNAWGIPYAAAMGGSKLVFPGPHYDGESLYNLMEAERVTLTAGVPTVWLNLYQYLERTGKRFTTLRRLVVGGAAVPLMLISALEDKYGISVKQAWGMTEMSPVGTTGNLKPRQAGLPATARHLVQAKQGRAIYGVDLKVVDGAGAALPHDGKAVGELLVRGPWVTSGYYKDAAANAAAFDGEGWFRTGDVVNIDADGYIQIIDRSKDLIKSGGEWISSIDLENAAVGHADVAEAAAIAVPHPKWQERPLLIVVPKADRSPTRDDILAHLRDKVAKWWLPDDVVFVKELPHTATGKIMKTALREQFKDHRRKLG